MQEPSLENPAIAETSLVFGTRRGIAGNGIRLWKVSLTDYLAWSLLEQRGKISSPEHYHFGVKLQIIVTFLIHMVHICSEIIFCWPIFVEISKIVQMYQCILQILAVVVPPPTTF